MELFTSTLKKYAVHKLNIGIRKEIEALNIFKCYVKKNDTYYKPLTLILMIEQECKQCRKQKTSFDCQNNRNI